MNRQPLTTDTGMGVSFVASAVIHLTVFLLVAWGAGRMTAVKIQETYYVDVINLPVASPQSGSAAQKNNAPPLPPTPPKRVEAAMNIPKQSKPSVKPVQTKPVKPAVTPKDPAPESSAEFEKQMAKLKQVDEAKQAEAAMSRMREKLKNQGSGRAGMPGASGKEAGSDYLAYLQSRLKDAFRDTISFTSKNPVVTVQLFIDADGKVSRKKTVSSSGDRAFEISVLRAIDTASAKFPAPPGRKLFEGVFVFKREGITQSKP
jgi:colicin import membrane protein